MNRYLIIGILLLVVLGVGGYLFFVNQNRPQIQNATPQSATQILKQEQKTAEGYSGNLIAGSVSPYLDFNQADYEKALSEGKTVFLEFYANWCPICRAQEPALVDGFNSLNDSNVVGFRVNYNDPETDDLEKQLAKQFGVTYQHTHVIVKNGKEVYRSQEDLTKEDLTSLIDQYLK